MKIKLLLLTLTLISSISFAQQIRVTIPKSTTKIAVQKSKNCVTFIEEKTIDTPIDQDGDGIIDSLDKCPTVAGTINGCPDSDMDGIIDSEDKCPTVAGTINGCPDSDKDGIIDTEDKCPAVPGDKTNNGCPLDTDGDGIYDIDDKCINEKGPKSNEGCPVELNKDAAAILGKYAKTIKFNSAKYSFKPGVTNTLDKVAKVMNEYKDINFEIDGYTDSAGNADKNLKLSQDRAQAVVDYLASHGIDRSRLIAKGFGIANPIATNETAAGRAENRRVEIVAQH